MTLARRLWCVGVIGALAVTAGLRAIGVGLFNRNGLEQEVTTK